MFEEVRESEEAGRDRFHQDRAAVLHAALHADCLKAIIRQEWRG